MPSTKEQSRKNVDASRKRDRKAGIVRVEVRIPAKRRAELLKLSAQWRKEATKAQTSGHQADHRHNPRASA